MQLVETFPNSTKCNNKKEVFHCRFLQPLSPNFAIFEQNFVCGFMVNVNKYAAIITNPNRNLYFLCS